MKAIKFTLSGNTAFFKKPEFNSYYYFTYGQIHRITLLGIFGAMLGLGGYNKQKAVDSEYPEFYNELKELKIAIAPKGEKGYFSKRIQAFNNSTGFASFEAGGNLIVKEQWLEKPAWDIYVLLDDNEWSAKIAQALLAKESVYTPYLGKNDHLTTIDNVEMISLTSVGKEPIKVISLCQKRDVKIVEESGGRIVQMKRVHETFWQYEEDLPSALTLQTNQYELERFLLTNAKLTIVEHREMFGEVTDGTAIQFI